MLHIWPRRRQLGPQPLTQPKRRLCSVVVEALAGLLEVAIALLCWVEPCLSQVLPVEGTAAQFLSFDLGPSLLDGQQLDVARQRDSPCSQTPGYMPPHCHWPGQTAGGEMIIHFV